MRKLRNLEECQEALIEDGYVIHISLDEKHAIQVALECDKEEREEAYETIDWMASPWDKARINLLEEMIEILRGM